MKIQDCQEFHIVVTKHPHLKDKLEVSWSSTLFDEMVAKLLFDTREGTRQGFSFEVGYALIRLLGIHGAEFPGLYMHEPKGWMNIVPGAKF